MNSYKITANARKVDAIGIFYPVTLTVQARTEEEARDYFFKIWCSEYEFSGITEIKLG